MGLCVKGEKAATHGVSGLLYRVGAYGDVGVREAVLCNDSNYGEVGLFWLNIRLGIEPLCNIMH